MTTKDTPPKNDENRLQIAPETFLLFDRQDDIALVQRLRGAIIKEYVYAFKQAGQMIYGLGADGAQAAKRELAKIGEVIREDEIDLIREDADYAYFRAKASRWSVVRGETDLMLDTTVELKRQAKFITRRDGTLEPDSFWLEKGGSKAMRNAILNLTPEPIKQQIIAAYKAGATIVEMDPDTADAMTHEAHAAFKDKDERAVAQKAREELFEPASPLTPLGEEHQALDQKISKATPSRIAVMMRRFDLGEGEWQKLDLASKAMLAKHLESKAK